MALKTFNPLTPTSRFKVLPAFSEITKTKPEKALSVSLRKTGGRNNQGRITCRHIGGGSKRRYRLVDFRRAKRGVKAEVIAVEYDPIRSARIALIRYSDGVKAYILCPAGLEVGSTVSAGIDVEPSIGNAMPLSMVPLGSAVHNVELIPGKGGQIARSAGQQVIVSNREAGYALLKLPSGEIRRVHESCFATIGTVGNGDHMNVSSGKAGRTRWKGVRPTVRGMVMNPVDHPNGGGQGKSKGGGGRQHMRSPWGQLAKGAKTRRRHNGSDKFIVSRRKVSS
jgi:large subunit ribosomal protein L2